MPRPAWFYPKILVLTPWRAARQATFIDFCRNNASGLIPSSVTLNGTVPLDFISTHEYAGGASNVNNAVSIAERHRPL